ncbi:MAG: helix-turn-helix domain-containing protein [Spirochaetota bacterium]|nr:helix-turn-helix domain-containing protein [Spirochaetota bacterium]
MAAIKEKIIIKNTTRKRRKKSSYLPPDYKTLQEVIDGIERDYILHTLELTNWNLQKTSRVLDIARNTLKAKMKKYNIDLQ